MSEFFYIVQTFLGERSVECLGKPQAKRLLRDGEEYVAHDSPTCKITIRVSNRTVKIVGEYGANFGFSPFE